MREAELVKCQIDDVWTLVVRPHQGKSGEILGDVGLQNGQLISFERVLLADADARRSWAEGITGEGKPDAETLLATLMAMVEPSIAALQEASARGNGRRSQPREASGGRPPFPFTDWGNAERLVAAYGGDFRWCLERKTFFDFDGTRWVYTHGLGVEAMAKDCVRAMYAEAAGIFDDQARQALLEHAMRSEGERRIKAAVSLAKSEPGVCVSVSAFDQDPFLFNCANGTLDLRTGTLREHRREDLLTKTAPVRYDAQAAAPTWMRFLERVLPSPRVRNYVQRALGYSLTGDCGEHCLFLPHGGGRNGKSTLLEVVAFVMGDYALQTRPETLLAKDRASIPNDVAALAGARFVPTVEVEEGRRLAESLVKQLTGGDTISARFMYGEYFTFRPTFKVWLAANHKPVIRGTDDAIWERIRLIPFGVTIPEEERDKKLRQKLETEAPGILRWMVQGCLEWQKDGLQTPEEIRNATKSYQDEMDTLGDFLTECCIRSSSTQASASALYEAYKGWCEQRGEQKLSQKAFGTKLGERGFSKDRDSRTNRVIWHGLGLRAEPSEPSEPSEPLKPETPSWGGSGPISRTNGPDRSDGSGGSSGEPEAHDLAEQDRLDLEEYERMRSGWSGYDR